MNDTSKLVIATCYRVGTLGIQNCNEICNALAKLLRTKRVKRLFLIGDFNLRNVNWETNSSSNNVEQLFLEEFFRLGLIQCIKAPTHIKDNILDVLLTNSENLISDIQIKSNCEICKSDHHAINFDIMLKIKRKKPIKIKRFNFKRANWHSLNIDLNSIDWISMLDCMEPDQAWKNFKDTLNHFLDIYIPKVTTKSNSQPPWFDTECYLKYKEKERLHKKYKSTKSTSDELKFTLCRKEFKSLIKTKMRDNLYCSNASSDICKQFWSHVKAKSNTNRIPEVLKHNGLISSHNITKANMFNDHFFEQFSLMSRYDIEIDFSNDEHFEIDFSCTKIKQFLDNINTDNAAGPDGIHGSVLKHCSVSLCRPLSIIFKLIYNTGIIPQEWKSANIVPIYKKGDKNLISNYRPISLLCLSAKIMERVVQDELLNLTGNLLNSAQHGFLSGKSCTTNLITLTDDIANNLFNDIGADIIYFDFAKAFDTVNHDLLLSKLKTNFKIDGRLLKFIASYLRNRQQRVVLDNTFSDYKPVKSGVPQGSILGPILFVLFINDISLEISPGTKTCLFADDTKIWRPMQSELDCKILQNDINNLNKWCKTNKMLFHPEKCKVVSIISNANRLTHINLLPFSKFSYILGSSVLNYEENEVYLGVIINDKLTWSDHQNKIILKASQMLGLTKRTCHFLINSKRKRTLYLTMVRSQLEHCSAIWRPVSATELNKFEVIQKNAIKWILNEELISYSNNETYLKKCMDINILPISKHFDLRDLCLFHKIVNDLILIKIPSYVSKCRGNSRLRNKHLDAECYICNLGEDGRLNSTSLIFKSFYYRTTFLWNKLPLDIRTVSSINVFKSRVTQFLWENAQRDIEIC